MRSRALNGPVRFFVPGRLEVFGKHTDYAGGRSLVAALSKGLTFVAEKTVDGQVIVDEGGAYARTVVGRLARNFPGADLSARIAFSSTLPPAAGMSSSTALVVGVAEALVACAELEERQEWRQNIRTVEDRAAYFACIENGASFGTLLGDAGVGTHGGSEDHAAILGGRAGHLTQFSFAPLRRDRDIAMPGGWTFAIATTGVEARKTGEAREAFNRLADPRLMAGRRRDHFLAEDARVPLAADAFARADAAALGDLAEASQADAEALLGNQVPETRALVDLARSLGAHAASGFGAGWGGSVWALVDCDGAGVFLARWLEAYRRAHPGHVSHGFISPPSDGLTRVPTDASR